MTSALLVADAEAVRLDEANMLDVSRLCVACSAFYELVEGQEATEATAAEILGPLESEYAHGVKHVWGFKKGGDLVAIAELLEGHPVVQDWYIGLLLVAPNHRRQGLGAGVCESILSWIAGVGGSTVRLLVQQQNPEARRFWERQGFGLEREMVKTAGLRENVVWILSRRVGGAE